MHEGYLHAVDLWSQCLSEVSLHGRFEHLKMKAQRQHIVLFDVSLMSGALHWFNKVPLMKRLSNLLFVSVCVNLSQSSNRRQSEDWTFLGTLWIITNWRRHRELLSLINGIQSNSYRVTESPVQETPLHDKNRWVWTDGTKDFDLFRALRCFSEKVEHKSKAQRFKKASLWLRGVAASWPWWWTLCS